MNFKFAEVRGDNGKTAATMFGYTGELGKSKTAIAEQTAYIATYLLRMQGYTATYQFNGDVTTDAGEYGANRAIIDADTGEMQITTKALSVISWLLGHPCKMIRLVTRQLSLS